MSERMKLSERINVMLFHFDQRLGPRLLFNISETTDERITSALTRLMDFNFLEEMKAFVNAMANVVYSSMFFSVSNPLARGGVEQFMLSVVVFDPTITEYLTIASLEDEISKTISKLAGLSEMLVLVTETKPTIEDYPEVAYYMQELKDKVVSLFQEIFFGEMEGGQDAISEVLRRIGNEAGKKIISELSTKEKVSGRPLLSKVIDSPILARWGKFSILHLDPYEKVATISVKHSIWADSLGVIATKTCAFIEGLLESIMSSILNDSVICRETRCASEYSYVKECMFQITSGEIRRERMKTEEEQTIKEMGMKEREEALEAIRRDIGEEFYYQIEDPMIRLIQLFNKASFISDFYFDEKKFLVVCNYWRYSDDIMCNSCQEWIEKHSKVKINLLKSKHRICEITYENEENKDHEKGKEKENDNK